MRLLHLPAFVGCLLLAAVPVRAGVGDPTIETDHPHYAGEGAFQTVEQIVSRVCAGKKTEQDKAIALYLWILSHQFHGMSPQEWNVPGEVPDANKEGRTDLIVYDVNRARFSYGYALCGTVHAWNQAYWKALGMNARSRGYPGHTSSEIEYDGSWHMYDTDGAGLVFRRDGVVAGYHDIIKDLSLFDVDKSPLPRFPFVWPRDFEDSKESFKEIAKGGHWYKLYNSSYAAHPAIVHLRSGETFTRYFDRDHFGGPIERRFWHHQKGGPFQQWTFVNMGTPEHREAKSNCRGNATYCNGEFVYRPNLSNPSYHEGVVHESANVLHGDGLPGLRSKDRDRAVVTFQHFSPYVIAGKPLDGANPMSKAASSGLVVAGHTAGPVSVEVSADQGQTWTNAGEVTGKFEKDLTEAVKGRYGWQVRFAWKGDGGLDGLTFTTVTQVAQTIYPRLKPDGCTVVYRARSRGVAPVLPNFGLPEDQARWEEKSLRSSNVAYLGRGPKSRLAYKVQDNKPGTLAFKVESPAELLQVTVAAKFNVRVPTPEGCDYRLEFSTDGGKTWRPLGRADVPKDNDAFFGIPKDNDASWGWMYGAADVAAAKTKTALVRVHLFQGGHAVGLMTADLYGVYRTPPPQTLKLTYAWQESGKLKTHTEEIAAGTSERTFQVPTGKSIVDEYVRLEAR
jgi:hypothetical protein